MENQRRKTTHIFNKISLLFIKIFNGLPNQYQNIFTEYIGLKY